MCVCVCASARARVNCMHVCVDMYHKEDTHRRADVCVACVCGTDVLRGARGGEGEGHRGAVSMSTRR